MEVKLDPEYTRKQMVMQYIKLVFIFLFECDSRFLLIKGAIFLSSELNLRIIFK